ncbi:MAG: cbb3-type cytochrome c oxidase N-terminal domain-containing protein [Ginsengibacter sp.]|jgi:cytochrome c oxidase cbb3-type subunit 3
MNKYLKPLLIISSFLAIHSGVFAQTKAPIPSSAREPLAIVMISIAVLLIAVIGLLGKIVITAYEIHKGREKRNKTLAVTAITAMLLLIVTTAGAQTTEALPVAGSSLIGGLSQTTFYFLLSVIILELIIIAFLVRTFHLFTGLQKAIKKEALGETEEKKTKKWAWFEKLNNTRSLDAASEAQVNLGHDYDGIGELDNPTPPWWQWGFVLSVIFAVVYLYVYHVSESAPMQIEELTIANAKAEKQIASYLATSSNLVDENTVTYLDDANDLASGKTVFTSVCAACHGVDGGGTVGPNLTDDYWLHGGGMKDIFKTIKYGVPEKGMKSWKDDYSPKQIAQLASYIHSIKGTKPAAPKAAEGTIYKEAAGE